METDVAHSRIQLRQAERLFSEQRYAELVKHLAPQIFLFRGDARYYFLLGIASLHIGDLSGAHSYLLRGKDLDPYNTDLELALAITHLSRKEEPQALQILVGIQDRHPTNSLALQFLDILKQASEKVDWPDQIRLGKLKQLYPRPGFNWRPWLKKGGIGAAALGAVALLGMLIYGLTLAASSWQAPSRRVPPDRGTLSGQSASPSSGAVAIDDTRFGVPVDAKPRFLLSAAEIETLSKDVTTAFREYRDNKARVLVNRIMQSNASSNVKERMRGLANHFKDPGFVNFKDNYALDAVVEDPLLHAGVFVMWRGKIADVLKGQTAITFNLLVGYESSPVVKATIPVSLDFAADINAGEAIELIGQVVSEHATGDFSLRGIALRLIRG